MSIESPSTFSDWYWKNWVEAQRFSLEDAGEDAKQYMPNVFDDPEMRRRIPFDFLSKFDALIASPSPMLMQVGARFVSEMADNVVGQAMNHAMKDFNYYMAGRFADQRITSPVATTLYHRRKIDKNFWQSRMKSEGYKEAEAFFMAESAHPYPTIPDLMLWGRYHGDPNNVRNAVWDKYDVPVADFDLWNWLTLQRLSTEHAHTLYRRGLISNQELFTQLARIGWSAEDRPFIEEINWLTPNAMLMVQGGLQQDKHKSQLLSDISLADINPKYAEQYLDAILTKPSSSDLVSYNLRLDPELNQIGESLQKIGIHPEYVDVYKTLAHPIPPVADIITMAVREAFSPAIAARFGQYEDLPDDYVYWAKRKGLTEDWSKRYWAAHWSLPSPQQGYEMLHRGIINESELNLLMRALDIMPFWRHKLMQMSFKRLTRVDVRRMYREGVLSEREVYESYLDLGYADINARRMSDFTVKQTLSTLAKFTTTDVIKAFTQRKIDRLETSNLLDMLGVRPEDKSFILSTAEYKRTWALTDQQISAVRNLYKKGVYDENQTRDKLSRMDLPADQISAYMEQWYYEIAAEEKPTWTTAQTISFAKKGIITKDRAETELRIIGYDKEHIEAYMKQIV